MREVNKIAESLFEKIRDRFEDVSLGDENAKATQDPESARFFNFDYVVDDQNYGNITLSIIDETSLKVYFSKNISHNLEGEERKRWYAFLRELREFAKRNLLSFEPRDITRSTLKHRDVQQVSKADSTYSKDEVIGEGRMYGTSRSSYENDGNVKLIVRHTGQVDPERRGDRSRKIKSIYVETAEGERLKLPHNSLRYARAMARHVSEGGSLMDDFGQHITRIAEECGKLRPFKSAMRRRTFEDSETQEMVEAAFEYHGLLNNTLKKISGRKGYAACKESFQMDEETLMDDFDADSMRERFVKRTYNDATDSALPIVQKAYNMKKSNKFAEQFESWANNVAEGTWAKPEGEKEVAELIDLLSEPLAVGVDAQNATNALYNIIGDDRLFDQLGDLAEENPEADARDVVMGWVQENMPEIYSQIMSEIGDEDTADQYSEGNTYGASGMDEPNVAEGWNTGNDRVSLPDTPHTYWSGNGALQDDYSRLYDELVPSQGKADTIEGEVLRASSKIVYRHFNDGDEFNEASFDQLEPYIGKVTSYDDLAHKAVEFALRANGNYTPNPDWDSLDVMDYGPPEDDYDDEEDDDYDDWSDNVDNEEEDDDEDLAEGGNYDEDQVDSIASAIIRRITNNIGQHQELLMKAGPDGVMNAARDVASFHAPVQELGSSDVSIMVREVYREVGVEYPELAEGKMKEVDMDLTELSDEEFQAKYGKSKEEMKAALAEGYEDHVNKDEKMKRMGAKPLSFKDKLKTIPQGIKAMAKGEPEDDVTLYNKQFSEDIAQMRRIAGLK